MLETQFLLVNAHFTLNLLAALVCFAVSWLYFDAWLGRRDLRESSKSLGFFLLSISFVFHATEIEQAVVANSIFTGNLVTNLASFARIGGYLTLIIGQVIDPLQPLPTYRFESAAAIAATGLPFYNYPLFVLPLLAMVTGYLYLRRATTGLEHHLKPISLSFYSLSFFEIFSLASLFRGSDNVDLENLVGPFGIVWITEHLILIFGMFFLGRWVWGYLIKRLETQLFMIFTTTTLVIFLLTAVFFTSVSLINLRLDILKNLEINVALLEFTINSKKAEVLSDAQVIAQNSEIIDAIDDRDTKTLTEITTRSLLAKSQAFSIVVASTGEVLSRADDPEKIGSSLSDDPLVKKALEGAESSGVVTADGVLAPAVSVQAAVPVRDSKNTIVGAVVVGATIDNAFVDGLKDATGLDASVYGDNVRSATTFVAPDGKSRYIGIKEESSEVKDTVLDEGENFTGDVTILNVPYLASFSPLLDTNGNSVGMLFVGRPQVSALQSAGALIEQTFLVTAILLAFSIIPSYFISTYIINQINA